MKNNFLIILLLSFFSISNLSSQHEILDNVMKSHFESSNLPGFSVALVNTDGIDFIKSYGLIDVSNKEVLTINTKQSIASITKTFTGYAMMQLVEQGYLSLDSPINDILPFEIINPKYPTIPITVGHLAAHTSSINDDDIESDSWYLSEPLQLSKNEIGKEAFKKFCDWNKNKEANLDTFLKSALTAKGRLFSKKRFTRMRPGKEYNYSNIGAALAAYIIEIKSGTDFRTYIQDHIASPLGIKDVWINNSSSLPRSYFQNQVPVPDHYPILYPAGGLYISINELSTYLYLSIIGYNGNSDILSTESIRKMMSPQIKINDDKSYGYFWEINNEQIGHNGGNYGVITLMSFDPATNEGKIFMTNISSYNDNSLLKKVIQIWKDLK